ncbi:MAG: hypothetical protein ABW007_25210 [Chitinophagaceae bacterium]
MAITRPITKTIISTTDFGIPVADQLNLNTSDIAALKPGAWQPVTFQNGWANESGFQGVRYCKWGNLVFVQGSCVHADATSFATVFQLPVGFRPPSSVRLFGQAFKTGVGGSYTWRGDMNVNGQFTPGEWLPASTPQSMTVGLSFFFSIV